MVDGQARETSGRHRAVEDWSVLIKDNHPSCIDWGAFGENRSMLGENAHMQRRAARKSGRGGRALLTGMARLAGAAAG